MGKDELRPCIVKMLKYPNRKRNQCSKVDPEEETHKGYFHTWGSEAYVTNGYIVGTAAGQMSTLYGVDEDGSVHRVPPECITFTDRTPQAVPGSEREKKEILSGEKQLMEVTTPVTSKKRSSKVDT